jgi:hypothetical protein
MSIFQSFYCIEVYYHSDSVTMREDVPWHVVYGFVNNRCQSVRQDITYQVLTTHNNHLHAAVSALTIPHTLLLHPKTCTTYTKQPSTTVGKEVSHIEIIIVPYYIPSNWRVLKFYTYTSYQQSSTSTLSTGK